MEVEVPDPTPPILQVRGMSKTFSGQTVLRDVAFELLAGEIHALVGENGSGKSTFIKCLAGYYTPEPGTEIKVAGRSLNLPYTPSEALTYGFSFIHQNLALIPSMSVAENLAVTTGFETTAGWKIRWGALRQKAQQALGLFGAHIDPARLVGDLPQTDRTLVAIARGLQGRKESRRVLVLDEPTAALADAEARRLFTALRTIAAEGVGIIYVSHKLGEILELAARVTAFRDGRQVGTVTAKGLTERNLVSLIIGRPLEAYYPPTTERGAEDTLLDVKALSGVRVRQVSFTAGRGEIVGVAGLLGAGRSELGRLVFGAQKRSSGRMTLAGQPFAPSGSAEGLRRGVCLVPQDRLGQGGVGRMTVAENITLPTLKEFWRAGRLDKRAERRAVVGLMERFNVRPRNPDAIFGTLSGGNQQKAILARALRQKPRLLILDEPVQGIDIGSKVEIYALIERVAAQGMTVLLINSDFQDLSRLCHRVLVLHNGEIEYELSGADLTSDRITELVYLRKEKVQ
jgi:ribose transport system ATP-binding protein